MREIKFRAWDEQKKVMHRDFQFIRSGTEGNDWVIFSSDKHTKYDDYIKTPYFQQQLKIMQFTGLKDKNGKEIYEGDILDKNGEFENHHVRWATIEIGGIMSYSRQFLTGWNVEITDPMESLVIGNIWENPELLPNLK